MPVEETTPNSLKKSPLPKILIGVVVLLTLMGIGFFLLKGNKNSQTNDSAQDLPTATTSANTTSNDCPNEKTFVYEKQGYQVCYPENWVQQEGKASGLIVTFSPTQETPGTFNIIIQDKTVEATVQETITNASKYEFEKTTLNNVNGTKITYTRGKTDPVTSHNLVIDTIVSTLGRTYTVRLNSNDVTRADDEKTYQEFLESFKFISKTQKPPWSESGNILVYSPWVGDEVKNPIHLTGEAIAFEGVVNIRIKDKDNHTLLETNIQTQSGTQRSPFDADLAFDNPSTKEGTLEVYTISAVDGSEQDKVTLPLIFP